MAVCHGLHELDYLYYSAVIGVVDFGQPAGKVFGMHHVAPSGTSWLGDPYTAAAGPNGRQHLDFDPTGITDCHCQVACRHGIIGQSPFNGSIPVGGRIVR